VTAMAGTFLPGGADPDTYRGLPALYGFVNADGELTRYNCGQAAACTLLTQAHAVPPAADPEAACGLMAAVEQAHPPDNLFGWLGTSRRRVERICQAHGIELEEVHGEDELRAALAAGRPAAMMVELPGPVIWRWRAPVGHWMVAYGYDDRQVFLSNYGAAGMSWDEFRRAWGGLVPRLISMRNTGLVARSS
jgi:hypothetical protein